MAILDSDRDPRTPLQRESDRKLLDRFDRGDALAVPVKEREAAAQRVLDRYRERRQDVASLGPEIANYRRLYGLTQESVARAIGTSTPNICAIEKGRAPGITVERLLAIVESLRLLSRTTSVRKGARRRNSRFRSLRPSAAVRSLEDALAEK